MEDLKIWFRLNCSRCLNIFVDLWFLKLKIKPTAETFVVTHACEHLSHFVSWNHNHIQMTLMFDILKQCKRNQTNIPCIYEQKEVWHKIVKLKTLRFVILWNVNYKT